MEQNPSPPASPASDRRVFKFNDGSQDQFRDPFDLHRRWYEATDGDPNALLAAVQEPVAAPVVQADGSVQMQVPEEAPGQYLARLAAYQKLIDAGRRAFELAPFDKATGAGVTDTDVIDILWAWEGWQDDVKKNTEPSPNSSPTTVATPPAPATSAMPRKSSDCGCS